MKKLHPWKILFFPLFVIVSSLQAQNVAINTSGNVAYASAILDLSNNNSVGTVGFLPPYVTLTSLTTFSPVTGTAAQSSGLLVYNTGGTYAAGLYYWNNTITAWVPMGSTLSGSGTLNYLARWTPSGSVLGIGVTQDNGLRVGIQTGVYAFTVGNMLQVTANATDLSAILGTTAEATGYGVQGTNTAGSGTTAGVYGSSTSATGYGVQGVDNVVNGTGVIGSNTQITGTSTGVTGYVGTYNAPSWGAVGVYGSANNSTTYGVEGNNPSGNPAGGAGVIGYDYSGTGVIGSNDLITQVGFYHGPHGTGGNFFSAYQGLVGSYNMTGAGGTGILGMGYNSAGPVNPNSSYNYDFGVLGEFGGAAGGAGSGAAVGGFIGNTSVPGFRAGVMGASNATDYGVLGYNTLANGYALAAINNTGNLGYGLYVSGLTYMAGKVGIFTNGPAQALEIAVSTNTARIDGLATGGTYNNLLATKSDLVYADDANGDLHSIPAPSAASTLVSSATGVLSWQNGVVPTGSGTTNYYARWTPSGTQLGIGFTEDNGTSISMSDPASAPVNNTMLTVTGNTTSVTAIVGTTAQTTGYGIYGISTAASGTAIYGKITAPQVVQLPL